MGKINVLDFHVANLIAAGEVVDRPASVVKELLENAIDAGADNITVEIKRGGVSFIRVTDNGCGIARDDVPIALKRHATSKIREAKDLDSIATLGFRGEALAAIASVSQLRIMTKRPEDKTGTLLEAHGGRVLSVTDAGCPDGTTMIVENLFYNTPARLKFLKKDGTEAGSVSAYVEKIALSHPDIALRFLSDGELKYVTAGDGNRASVVYAVLGREFARKTSELHGGFDGVQVDGYIGTPENVRGNRNLQIFFINNRYIRSKTVSAALEQAFATFIPGDKFPCAVIYLTMHPGLVDVNVHPAKLEVKFSNERLIFESVYYAVRGVLENSLARPELALLQKNEKLQEQRETVNALAPGKEGRGGEPEVRVKDMRQTLAEGLGNTPVEKKPADEQPKPEEPRADTKPQKEESDTAFDKTAPAVQNIPETDSFVLTEDIPLPDAPPPVSGQPYDDAEPRYSFTIPPLPTAEKQPEQQREPVLPETSVFPKEAELPEEAELPKESKLLKGSELPKEAVQSEKPEQPKEQPSAETLTAEKAPSPAKKSTACAPQTAHTGTAVPEPAPEKPEIPEYRMVGEVFQCYVIVEMGNTMYVIDKHAAHERILFEEFKKTARENVSVSQMLLMPLTVTLSSEEVTAAAEFEEEIFASGYAFQCSGREAELYQIPAFLDSGAAKDAFCEAVSRLADQTGTAELAREQRFERALFQASCKAAIKAGRSYDDAHLRWICDRVLSDPAIRYCPHGRPVCYEITKSMIENRFGRT